MDAFYYDDLYVVLVLDVLIWSSIGIWIGGFGMYLWLVGLHFCFSLVYWLVLCIPGFMIDCIIVLCTYLSGYLYIWSFICLGHLLCLLGFSIYYLIWLIFDLLMMIGSIMIVGIYDYCASSIIAIDYILDWFLIGVLFCLFCLCFPFPYNWLFYVLYFVYDRVDLYFDSIFCSLVSCILYSFVSWFLRYYWLDSLDIVTIIAYIWLVASFMRSMVIVILYLLWCLMSFIWLSIGLWLGSSLWSLLYLLAYFSLLLIGFYSLLSFNAGKYQFEVFIFDYCVV
jgi:hypothetical protein